MSRVYKPVEQISTFGEIITLYYCAAEAARAANVSYQQMVQTIENNVRLGRYYYRWYYAEDNTQEEPFFPIEQRLNGEVVNRFKSVLEASKALEYGRNTITKLINSGELDQWGCTWHKITKKEKEVK